jgi:hypothetical protein
MRAPSPPYLPALLLLWAFRLAAQVGSEPLEHGWVATATPAACDAAQRGVWDMARAYGVTIEIGDCREVTPDDLRRFKSNSPQPVPSTSAAHYHGLPAGPTSRGPRP